MGHCIQKYSRGRDDHLYITQHRVPNHLLRPQLNLVQSSERARLCSRDVLGDGTILLQAEGDGRCQEPYQLARIRERARLSEYEAIWGTRTLFPSPFSNSCMIRSRALSMSASRHHKLILSREAHTCVFCRFLCPSKKEIRKKN